MKRVLLGFLILVVIFIGAVIVGPSFINWNDYKSEIAEQVRKATGRELVINGDIEIKVLPAPALIANNVTLNNIDGATEAQMIKLKSVKVMVALSPLLGGKIKVETISLVEPQIEIEVLANGDPNWIFEPDTGNTATLNTPATSTEASAVSIAFDNITIENGTIVYRDQVSGTTEKVTLKQAKISASSLAGPFKSDGSVIVHGIPFTYSIKLGEIAAERSTPINLKLGITPGKAKVEVAGTLLNVFTSPRFKGQIASTGENLKALLNAASGSSEMPAALTSTFGIEASLNATLAAIDLTDLTLKLGDSSATGTVEIDFSPSAEKSSENSSDTNIDFMVKLTAPRIDLDALLAASQKTDGNAPSTTKKAPLPEGQEATPLIPQNINGSIELISDIITYRNGLIRNVRLNSELSMGGITLNEISAQFPGGSDFAIFGTIGKKDGHPVFQGELESNVNNLRGVLSWLGTDLDQVPSDRLRKVNLTSKLLATDEYLQFSSLDLKFDSSHLEGGVTWALRDRLSFGANIKLNRLNLDSYLPSSPADTQPSKEGVNPFAALSILKTFDANITANIQNLVHHDMSIKDIMVDATLFNGDLDIRKASVKNFAGATAQIKGKLTGLNTAPTAENLQFQTSSKNIAPLLKFLKVTSPINPKGLGAVALKGSLNGSFLKPNIDIGFTGADTALSAKGSVSLLPVGNAFSGNIAFKNNDLPKLLLLLGSDYKPAGKVKTLDLQTAITAGYDNRISLGKLNGKIGPLSFSGNADMDFSGVRPALKIAMNTGALDIGTFLPKQQDSANNAAGGAQMVPAAFGAIWNNAVPVKPSKNKLLYRAKISNRWSTEPIDLSGLSAVDLDLVFSAPIVTYDKYLLEKANVSATLINGLLQTRHLNATIFGGKFTGAATAATGAQNTFMAQGKLAGARVEDALATVTGTAGTTGSMDIEIDLGTAGLSEAGLVSALDGKGAFSFRGVDVRKGAKGSSLAGFIDLILSLNQMTDSKNADLANVAGTFTVSRGIAQSQDIVLTSGVGDGDAAGMVNLPDWTIDMGGTINAKPNVLTALLAVKSNLSFTRLPFTIKGPLDDPITNIERGDLKGASSPIEGLMQGLGSTIQGLLPTQQPSTANQQQVPTQQAPTEDTSGGSAPPPQPSSQQQPQPSGQILDPAKLLKSIFD